MSHCKVDSKARVEYRNSSSGTYRQLTDEEIEKLRKQDVVGSFKQRKLEIEACKNWDKFYNRNQSNFFKDRHWSGEDLRELCSDIDLNKPLTYLEAGCGVGNMLFPLFEFYPNLYLQAFDFSSNAIQILKKRAEQLQVDVDTSLVDLSNPCNESPFSSTADIATLIFVLSAIHPGKHLNVVHNMRKFVKVGGSVIVRDYGVNDHAMIRFGRGAKLSDRFYVRQDGTRAYYFLIEELVSLFDNAGFTCAHKEYLHRHTINHQKGLNVPRIFVQARFIRKK